MDYSCLVDTPKISELRFKLSFDNEKDMLVSLRVIESAYWDYIDNYYSVYPRKYRYYKLTPFLEKILAKDHVDLVPEAFNMIKKYTKYKKSLATDGVILYTMDEGLHLLLVNNTGSKMWSMPKGKRESGEESFECAVREFKEETGIDISDSASRDMKSVAILKTNFYILEADHKLALHRYHTNEIAGVRWVPVKDIMNLNNSDMFSKQTYQVGQYILDQEF